MLLRKLQANKTSVGTSVYLKSKNEKQNRQLFLKSAFVPLPGGADSSKFTLDYSWQMAILLVSMHLLKNVFLILLWLKKNMFCHIYLARHIQLILVLDTLLMWLLTLGYKLSDALNKVGDFSLPHFLASLSYIYTTSRAVNNRPFKFIWNNDYFFSLTFLNLGSHSLATFHLLYFTKWEERLGAGGSSDLSWFKS